MHSSAAVGLITGGGDRLEITAPGIDALGSYDPLPTGSDLQQHWLKELPKCESTVLGALIGCYPATLTKEELGGYGNVAAAQDLMQ